MEMSRASPEAMFLIEHRSGGITNSEIASSLKPRSPPSVKGLELEACIADRITSACNRVIVFEEHLSML